MTIRDDRGDIAAMRMPDPSTVRAISVGDVMDIAYTVVLAIGVRTPAAQF